MGCGGSKEKEEGLFQELESQMEEIGVESLDSLFKEASEVIDNLEEIRQVIMDNRLDTIINTGACSHIKPDIEHCLKGLLLKISADNGGSFISAGFDVELEGEKIFTLTGENNTQEGKDALESFTTYIKGIWSVKDKVEGIVNNFKAISEKIMESKDTLIEDCKNHFQDNPLSGLSAIKKLNKNFDKLSDVVKAAPQIPKELVATLDSLKGFPALIKDVGYITKVDDDAKKAKTAGKSRAFEICYFTYDPQSRYGKIIDDGYKIWVSRREGKKAKKDKKKQKK
jgi:hypothetical protein